MPTAETPKTTFTPGDMARKIVDKHRKETENHSRTELLEIEFPRFTDILRRLGASGLYLTNAADNLAGTFKLYGALVGLTDLKNVGKTSARVFSAGNHARGATVAAKLLGMELHIGVPTTAPPAKSEKGLRELWGESNPGLYVHQVGATLEETQRWMNEHPEFGPLLHPFDNPHVIAGQGTIADDIIDSAVGDDIKHIAAPIGGGGLVAGILERLQERRRSDIIVHAIEGPGNDSASRSLAAGEITDATAPNELFGGGAVQRMGQLAFNTLRSTPNFRIHSVTIDDVARLVGSYETDRNDLWRNKTPAFEPTSLVAIAGLAHIIREYPGESAAVVGTGYNDSFRYS